jgi:hypothetical protein
VELCLGLVVSEIIILLHAHTHTHTHTILSQIFINVEFYDWVRVPVMPETSGVDKDKRGIGGTYFYTAQS